MGIFGAMSAAVSGLQAQSYAIENIAGNISNSQTTGFKRVDTGFQDFLPDRPPRRELSGGASAFSRMTNTIQGDIQNSGSGTHMAINGDGYFVVQRPSGTADGLPVFSGTDYYTRRGDFQTDKDGYLVNGSGFYLKALELDRLTGNPVGSTPTVVRFNNDFLPAQKTETIEYRANLASYPLTQNADRNIAGSEFIDPTLASATTITGAQEPLFLQTSISGGSITSYDTSGSPVNVQFRWAKLDNSPSTWRAFYQANSNAAGATPAWESLGVDYVFGSNGQLTSGGPIVTVPALTVNGIALGSVAINHGTGGLTQFADGNGVAQVNTLQQDGYSAGELTGIAVSQGGIITANYTNDRNLNVARIPMAVFNADHLLDRIDGGAFAETLDSGSPIIGGTGNIVGGSLEASNSDISDEFSKMIITQQAYAANTRVISTSQQMIQEVLSMIR